MPNETPSPGGGGSPLFHDILGVKAFGDMGLEITKGMVAGASAFLSRICLPVAEEIGDWARDEVHHMRKRRQNAVRLAERARRMVEAEQSGEVHAPPRLVAQVIEKGSWSDDEELQQMWAGLLATACTPEGRDDSNMIYTDLLGRMTAAQIRLLNTMCGGFARGVRSVNFIIVSATVTRKTPDLLEIMQLPTADDVRPQIEFMRSIGILRELELQARLFYAKDKSQMDITPTRLGLSMYMRCQGFRGTLEEFYERITPSSDGQGSTSNSGA